MEKALAQNAENRVFDSLSLKLLLDAHVYTPLVIAFGFSSGLGTLSQSLLAFSSQLDDYDFIQGKSFAWVHQFVCYFFRYLNPYNTAEPVMTEIVISGPSRQQKENLSKDTVPADLPWNSHDITREKNIFLSYCYFTQSLEENEIWKKH